MQKKTNFINPYNAALIFIFILNAFLKWRFFCGLVQADDFSYGVYSFTMFRLPLPWDMSMDFRVLRLALLMPVAFLFLFLPPGELTAVLYPLAVSFGTVLMVYLISRKLYGVHAGLFAAFVIATFPADVIFGTMLLPDILVPFYLSLAVWAFLNAESGTGNRSKLWYVLTGISLFLAFNSRENSYYFLLFFLPFAFNGRRWKRGLYLAGAGFVIPIIVLYTFYYFKSGDFLFNLHLAEHYSDPLIKSGYIPPNSANLFVILYYMLPGLTGRSGYMSTMYGYTFYLGIPCIIYTMIKALKKKDMWLLIVPWCFFVIYLFLEFGSISFTSYQMMKKLPRFLLTMTPAMAIGYGIVISDALGLGKKKIDKLKKLRIRWATGSLSFIVMIWLVSTLYGVLSYQKQSRDSNMRVFKWGYFEVLKDKPHRPIYGTGGWWNNKLSFYFLPDIHYADMPWRHSDMLRDLKTVKDTRDLGGSYVILDRNNFSGMNDLRIKHSYDDFGSYVKLPPKEWKLLGSKWFVDIYEIPEGWTYVEPDEKELVLGALLYSVKINDVTLFLNSLHPDFPSLISLKPLSELFETLGKENDPMRNELLEKRIEYRKYNGRWKIQFVMN